MLGSLIWCGYLILIPTLIYSTRSHIIMSHSRQLQTEPSLYPGLYPPPNWREALGASLARGPYTPRGITRGT